jgi:O-antigen ligase
MLTHTSQDITVAAKRSFWNDHFVPTWIPLLLGLALAVGASIAIAGGQLFLLIPLACIVPAAIIFLRYPFVAVMIWALAFPFVVENPDGSGRLLYTLIHRVIVPGAFGLALLSDWLRIRKREPVRFGRTELMMLCFLIAISLNIILLGSNQSLVKQFIRFYDRLLVPFCLYGLIRLTDPTERDFRRLTWVAAFVVVTQVMIGLIGWFSPAALPDYWRSREGQRTVGTLGNPAVYTVTLLFFGLMTLRYALLTRNRLTQLACFAIFGLAYVGVLFSFSRGSWLGALVVWGGLMVLYPRQIRRTTFAMLGVAIVAMAMLPSLLNYTSTRLEDADTAEGRILGATTQLNMIEQRPFFGWGYYNYDVYDEQFKQRVGNLAIRDSQTSHNQFLLIASELGLGGLLLYLLPPAWLLLLSIKVGRRMPMDGFRSRPFLVMLWLVLLHHVIVNNFMEMFESYLFGTTIWWIALGLIAAIVYPYVLPQDVDMPAWTKPRTARSA